MAKIIAVCKSDNKGCKKQASEEGTLEKNYGLIGDAHADFNSHRQLSLLAIESIRKIRQLGADVHPGDFAENLTTKGIELHTLPIGTRLRIGDDIELELTQIGKECHDRCAIFKQVGTCVMPLEGIFTRVISGGVVKVGDKITKI
ncbi:MAG: MOSC domain-containing protein [Dehalococcoidia bacterium]|nr:MAG: MOSC domain-containing protein [Dehalococcoidia bacterium]